MNATVETQERYLFSVDKEEAGWLKAYLKNPRAHFYDESEYDEEMRSRYFHAIDRVLPS